jgi:hypothetical protein
MTEKQLDEQPSKGAGIPPANLKRSMEQRPLQSTGEISSAPSHKPSVTENVLMAVKIAGIAVAVGLLLWLLETFRVK